MRTVGIIVLLGLTHIADARHKRRHPGSNLNNLDISSPELERENRRSSELRRNANMNSIQDVASYHPLINSRQPNFYNPYIAGLDLRQFRRPHVRRGGLRRIEEPSLWRGIYQPRLVYPLRQRLVYRQPYFARAQSKHTGKRYFKKSGKRSAKFDTAFTPKSAAVKGGRKIEQSCGDHKQADVTGKMEPVYGEGRLSRGLRALRSRFSKVI